MKKVAFTLTPAASKRLIAKAVVALPEVQHALQHGKIIVANGTTNAYIVEELGFGPIAKANYTAGIITGAAWCTTPAEDRLKPLVLEKGQLSQRGWPEVLDEFTGHDVFIKGGNALDLEGNVGILLGNPVAGTIGQAFRKLVAVGGHLVLPVGLEKLIPCVHEACAALGLDKIDESYGMSCGMFPVSYGTVLTELDAIHTLYGLESRHVSSGGVGGSEGAVGLVAWGNREECDQMMTDIGVIRNEPPLLGVKGTCSVCGACLNGQK